MKNAIKEFIVVLEKPDIEEQKNQFLISNVDPCIEQDRTDPEVGTIKSAYDIWCQFVTLIKLQINDVRKAGM